MSPQTVHVKSLCLALLLVSLGGCATAGQKPSTASKTILLTGFQPFGGRARNNSYETAKRLKADPSLIGDGIAVELCELPVEYGRGAKVAEACYESLQARGVKV